MSPITEEDSTTDSNEFAPVSKFKVSPADLNFNSEQRAENQVMKMAAVGLFLLVMINVFDFIL